jgi:hypothetical protein
MRPQRHFIDAETRAEVFGPVMEIARGEHSAYPVPAVDVNVELQALALSCAATLNPDPDQRIDIENMGTRYQH